MLEKFLGLFTESTPDSLPEGASPLVLNSDFQVGGVFPRPGLSSVYTLSEISYCGFAVDNGAGSHPWQNPVSAVGAPTGIYSTVQLTHGQNSNGLNTTNYGFSVAAGATIQSISVNVTAGISGFTAPSLRLSASIIYRGSVLAEIFPVLFVPPTGPADAIFNFTATNVALANALTPAVVNDPSFGVQFQAQYSGTVGSPRAFRIASPQIALAFSAPPSLNFNYLKTFQQTDGQITTLALDSTGTLWQENVNTAPGILTPLTQSQSLQTVSAYAGTGVDSGTGGFPSSFPWTNASALAGTPQGIYATNTLSGAQNQNTNFLLGTNYGFALPGSAVILGVTVVLTGHFAYTVSGVDAPALDVSLVSQGAVIGNTKSTTLVSATDTTITLGTAADSWNAILTAAILNDSSFGVQIGGQLAAGRSTPKTSGTFAFDGAQIFISYLLFSDTIQIQPNTFAESATVDDREFIAFSNLQNGTDIPRTYDGTNFDRMSQVGPGAPPTASITSSGSPILTITQNPAIPLLVGAHDFLLVSDSPSDIGTFGTPKTPGNVMALIFRSATTVPAYITPGSNIVLAGFPTINGNVVNNDPAGVVAPKFYTVTSVGMPITGEQSYDAIVFTVNFTTFYAKATPAGCTIQATEATMTTANQVPNLEVGSSFQIAGTGGAPPTGYDSSWTVDETLNASQLQITSTVLNANIATYGFNLVTGTLPAVGEAVTVTLTLNGNGIFNVTNAIITSVTAGTFSVALQGPNVPSAAENGGGIILGTIFQFDAFQIIGNVTGGTVIATGIIAAGIRKICYSFLTRNGYITQPSPILTFDVPSGASSIAIADLLAGPSNVVARIIHLTAANGGNFYNIAIPVIVTSNGLDVTNSSTYVNDNTTTNVALSFSDAVLLGATQIDVSGNNLFETAEIGAPVAIIPYQQRVFLIGEQNKVSNLLNYSFDGGIKVIQNSGAGSGGATITYPAGWTIDPIAGSGGGVVASPIFGNAYKIINTTGGTSGNIGMITQPAFQDEFMVPIIDASTEYSVRVTFANVTTASVLFPGTLIVDLYSPIAGKAVGTFSVSTQLNASPMKIYTGTLLTTVLAPVPKDLLLRVYGTNLPNGTQLLIDRVEVFPTQQPNLSTQILGSYQGNFEAFDQVDGVVDGAQQNQQPINSGFTLYDTLYMVKSASLLSTQDNKTTQPSEWPTPRVISNVVGTPSVYGVAGIQDKEAGEEWAVIAGQPGAFIFDGGQPIKIMEEIQGLWNQINWAYGYTLKVVNDVVNRRILFFVPMKTPNPWLPTGLIPDNPNPTTPNVVLALNYKFLVTAGELADRADVHVSSFGGKLLSIDMSRKWNIWTIGAPCAAFITRQDNTTPLFLGNSQSNGKIYQLVPGQLDDDGNAFMQLWTSHGFPVAEQEQQLQLGSVRKLYDYMSNILGGSGTLVINVFPDSLTTPYAHPLLPNLTLPATTGGDVEIPVNEVGNRLYLQFMCNSAGSGFNLSRIMLSMSKDPFSPVRGSNT